MIYICRGSRAQLYKDGIGQRVAALAKEYLLDRVAGGGLLIDCGANVGELGLWARAKGLAYIPFEPEPLEAMCNDLNNFQGQPKTGRYALWNETGIRSFYSAPEWGDSSLIQPHNPSNRIDIQATTLDSALDRKQLLRYPQAVILKVEVEGRNQKF